MQSAYQFRGGAGWARQVRAPKCPISEKSPAHKHSHDILRATGEQVRISANFFYVNLHPLGTAHCSIASVKFGAKKPPAEVDPLSGPKIGGWRGYP
jgi:hypothetical protein